MGGTFPHRSFLSRFLEATNMTTMRESTPRGGAKAKAPTAVPKPSRSGVSGVKTVAKSRRSAATRSAAVDPQSVRDLIAAEAYFLAERRGFIAGHELEDWVAAERVVESRREAKSA
jgi:hypothetical protein